MSDAERQNHEFLPTAEAQETLTKGTKKALEEGFKKRKTILVCPIKSGTYVSGNKV